MLEPRRLKSVFSLTLILNRLTSRILKWTLILVKTLTDPYNGGLLKGRLSVLYLLLFKVRDIMLSRTKKYCMIQQDNDFLIILS